MQSTRSPVAGATAHPSWSAMVAGAVGAGVSLAVGELAAGLVGRLPSLVGGVATFVIDVVPTPVKDLAIALFGTADKAALAVGIVLVTVLLGGWVGRRSGGRAGAVTPVFAAFGLAGALAAARTPQATLAPALLNGGISVLAGVMAHLALLRRAPVHDASRRSFLLAAGALAALALVAAAGGRALIERTRRMLAGREDVVLPPAAEPAPPPSASAAFDVPGISPLVTPNEDFYRIDTAAFSVPRVDLADWRVTVRGMVDRTVTLAYPDLLEMPMVERYVTLTCVSNRVGGDLVGTAEWLGVPLDEVLRRAGVQDGAEQVVGRSVDGFTVGFPVEAVFDGRVALLAVGMNGEPLPFEHGFPARLVVAGLYGYVSATKWLSEIELTTWDAFDAYWIPRGWAKEAPIKTQSRIDTPRPRAVVPPGPVPVAGVAWAPDRGISRVEVSVDGGEWREAEMAATLSDDTWRQWRLVWEATPGEHGLRVRATDGTGETQTEVERPPAPDGATGYHEVTVEVV